jgi:hypothetical protein
MAQMTDYELRVLQSLCALQQRLDQLLRGDPRAFPPLIGLIRRLDLPIFRIPQPILAGASLIVTWDVVPQSALGIVTRIGTQTSNATDTRITTRVNGFPVEPLIQVIGAVGDMQDPPLLATPIDLNPGDVFSLVMENIGMAPRDMAARTMGYFYEHQGV